jgi:hypothetical protein
MDAVIPLPNVCPEELVAVGVKLPRTTRAEEGGVENDIFTFTAASALTGKATSPTPMARAVSPVRNTLMMNSFQPLTMYGTQVK